MKKIFSITLAIYFLTTSVGFWINTHFCAGKIIEAQVQLIEHELGCGMNMETLGCEANTTTHFKKKSCCENQFRVFQVEDDFQSTDFQHNLHPVFITAFFYSFLIPEFAELEETTFLSYSPPLLKQDVQVLFQSFLI